MSTQMSLAQVAQEAGSLGDFFSSLLSHVKSLCQKQREFQYVDNDNFPASSLRMAMPPSSCRYAGRAMWSKDLPAGPDCNGCVFGQALQAMGWSDAKEIASGKRIHDLIADFLGMSVGLMQQWKQYLNTCMQIQKAQDQGAKWGDLLSMIPEV